jgi:peptidoglycan-N-acetylglucosamine deacetylase
MMNFRYTNVLFLLLILLFSAFRCFLEISWIWLIVFFVVYSIIVFLGSSRIDSGFHFQVICRYRDEGNSIMLSFDDGPDPTSTPEILDVLKKHKVPAVFFLIGHKAEACPQLVRRIVDEGHIIANHSYRHSNFFDLYLPKFMIREISHTKKVLFDICGVSVRWFRPPYGVTNPWLAKAVRETGSVPVGWSLRSFDKNIKNRDKLLRRLERVKAGDIILFHDTADNIALSLDAFIIRAKENGFRIAEPESALGIAAYN